MNNIVTPRASLFLPVALLAVACSKNPEPSTTTPIASTTTPAPAPSASAAAVTPFEGELVVSVKGDAAMKLPTSITYDVKGSKVRYVPAAAPIYALADLDAHQFYEVDDAQKSYAALDAKPAPNAKGAPAPTVQKMGKTEKIAGLDCENWKIDDGNEKVDVCASKGISYFDLASDARTGSPETPWAVALTTEKAFPLRVIVHDKAGKEEYRAEVTRADRKQVDDAAFRPPSTYKTANLSKEAKTASLP